MPPARRAGYLLTSRQQAQAGEYLQDAALHYAGALETSWCGA